MDSVGLLQKQNSNSMVTIKFLFRCEYALLFSAFDDHQQVGGFDLCPVKKFRVNAIFRTFVFIIDP